MRMFPLLTIFLFILSSFSVQKENNFHVLRTPSLSMARTGISPAEKIMQMKIKEVEKVLGRKLTLKEKIAFKIAQLKLKKEFKPAEKTRGQKALTLSIIALCLLVIPVGFLVSIPLAIIAMAMGNKAKKENPDDRKAKTAVVLSMITLALVIVTILLVAILLSAGGFAAL